MLVNAEMHMESVLSTFKLFMSAMGSSKGFNLLPASSEVSTLSSAKGNSSVL